MDYAFARQCTKTAHERYNYASAALELAQIKERLAELQEQVEPARKIVNSDDPVRDKIYISAYYVVVGRMPNDK